MRGIIRSQLWIAASMEGLCACIASRTLQRPGESFGEDSLTPGALCEYLAAINDKTQVFIKSKGQLNIPPPD